MKVSGPKSGGGASRTGASKGASAAPKKPNEAKVEATVGAFGQDAVEIGGDKATIDLIQNLVSREGDIRPDEVARVAKKLKNGQFKIDFEKVAEGFIRDVIMNHISKKNRKA